MKISNVCPGMKLKERGEDFLKRTERKALDRVKTSENLINLSSCCYIRFRVYTLFYTYDFQRLFHDLIFFYILVNFFIFQYMVALFLTISAPVAVSHFI